MIHNEQVGNHERDKITKTVQGIEHYEEMTYAKWWNEGGGGRGDRRLGR